MRTKNAVIALALLALIIGPVSMTGCRTTTSTGGVTTTTLDPTRTAEVLRVIIAAGVPFAVHKNTNCIPYLRLVSSAIQLAVDANSYNPDSLVAQINAISPKVERSYEAQSAINAVVGIYRLYFGDVTYQKLSETVWLKPVLKAIVGGLNDALPPP